MTRPRPVRLALCLVAAVSACGRERTDPRLAEVTTPVHVTVRVIDLPVEKHCEGTLGEHLSCLLSRAPREGCVYVEGGAAADAPLRSKQTDTDRCASIRHSEDRRVLVYQPWRKATLFVEPGGERVVVDLVDVATAIYLHRGRVLERQLFNSAAARPATFTRPDGTLDWSAVPPFLAVLDAVMLERLSEEELDALLLKTPGGRAALQASLLAVGAYTDLPRKRWDFALSKLDEAGRQEVRDAMLQRVADAVEGSLEWFVDHPEDRTPALFEAIEGSVGLEMYTNPWVIPVLYQFDPARAERVACQLLEQHWHQSALNPIDYGGSMLPDAVLPAVLVARQAKCPWVMPLLERDPCSADLRCDPDPDDGKEAPLCSTQQAQKPLHRALHPEAEEPEEPPPEEEYVSDWGALMLAAAEVQGPFSASFRLANERRLYRPDFTFKGDEADDPCKQLSTEPADVACRLPPSITSTQLEGCQLVLDDAKKTLTLTPVDAGTPAHVRPFE